MVETDPVIITSHPNKINGLLLGFVITVVQLILISFTVLLLLSKLGFRDNLKEIYPTVLQAIGYSNQNNSGQDNPTSLTNITNNQPSEFDILVSQAYLQLSEEKYNELLDTSNKMTPLAVTDEQQALVYFIQGDAYYRLKDNVKAELFLNKSIEKNPKFADAYALLASISNVQQNYSKMKMFSEKCLIYEKDHAWCHNNLGVAYMMLDQKSLGIAEFKTAVSLDPATLVFSNNLRSAEATK